MDYAVFSKEEWKELCKKNARKNFENVRRWCMKKTIAVFKDKDIPKGYVKPVLQGAQNFLKQMGFIFKVSYRGEVSVKTDSVYDKTVPEGYSKIGEGRIFIRELNERRDKPHGNVLEDDRGIAFIDIPKGVGIACA